MENLFDQIEEKGSPPSRGKVYLIPILLILLLVGLFLWVGRETFIPMIEVDAVKVRLAPGEIQVTKTEGGAIFQAAGWIEAEPYPIRVTALVSGIVQKIYVIAGEKVKKDQLLAKLMDEDLFLELRETETRLSELEARIAIRRAMVTVKKADKKKLNFELETQRAVLERLKHRVNSLGRSGTGISQLDKEQAELLVREQKFKIEEFQAQKELAQTLIELAQAEEGEVDQQIKNQKVRVDKVKLDISRLEIKAPIDGIIQHLYAREGRKQMLDSDNEMSTTIAEIYDPSRLQVRVDVPLSDISKVFIGQKTLVFVEASKQYLEGQVTILGGQADYQKNTLEVKVRLAKPQSILRPDMLAQVKFQEDTKTEKRTFTNALFIKKDCLRGNDKEPYVWVVSLEDRLEKRKIDPIGEKDNNWIVISKGAHPGERVVIGKEDGFELHKKVKIRRLYE